MEGLAGVILAAGLSSRMGAYKPLLPVGGVSMIRRAAAMMRDAGADPILVVTGYRHEELERHLEGAGVRCVYNPDYAKTQQLDSLCLALAALEGQCGRVIISPADVPLVEQSTVDGLLGMQGDFIRPVYHGEAGHPVVLDSKWIPYLCSYDGPGGLRGAMERAGGCLVELEVEDRGITLDNDTPEDMARTRSWHERRGR